MTEVIIIFNSSVITTMKMLTVSALLCATMFLTRASPVQPALKHSDEPSAPPPSIAPSKAVEPARLHSDEPSAPPPSTAPLIGEFGPDGWRPFCPPDWTELDIRCVRYVAEQMTWAEAEENCGSLGGSLISVFETEHFSDIKELIRTAGPVWVGGSKAPEGSSWSWSDYMSPSSFPNFCSEGNSMTNCLQASFKEDGQGCLEAVMCEAKLPSVCSILIM